MFLWGIGIAERKSRKNNPSRAEAHFVFVVILIIRTWAIWGRNKIVGIGLLVLLCGLWIVSSFYLSRFLRSFHCESHLPHDFLGRFIESICAVVLAKTISPSLTGCVITGSGDELYISFVVLMLFESSE